MWQSSNTSFHTCSLSIHHAACPVYSTGFDLSTSPTNMSKQFHILDLPADILVLIFPYLDPADFISFCRSNKACWADWYLEPQYWRIKTRQTFRIPDQPLLHADGERWHWLYRKMRTDTKAFTWGQNMYDCLGQGARPGIGLGRRGRHLPGSKVPTAMEVPKEVGIIADLQCGGWSTTLLNSDGVLFSVGMLDAADGVTFGLPATVLTRLAFPPGYPETTSARSDPSTAIKYFSSGRRHVLAVSDDGKLWSWHEILGPGSRVELSNIMPHGRITRVVAGWAESSAYVQAIGIVYWKSIGQTHPEVRGPADDGASVAVTIVPRTSFTMSRLPAIIPEEDVTNAVGEVVQHICLEDYIVFYTNLNKVFAHRFGGDDIVELTTFSEDGRKVRDLQGSFRNFAVFSESGEVLTADKSLLDRLSRNPSITTDLSVYPQLVPVLQNNDIISIAFGDYHLHALHSTGRISSYGTDSSGCGALGLGHPTDLQSTGKWRGLFSHFRDARIAVQPDQRTFPHYIWFEPEKQRWLEHLSSSGLGGPASHNAINGGGVVSMVPPNQLASFSEWVEQEGLAWDDFPDIKACDADGLGTYFALNVAAAGWHSGALVLVNEDLANKIRDKHVVEKDESGQAVKWRWSDQPFPKVLLPDGYVTGANEEGDRHPWRYGMQRSSSSRHESD